MIRDLAEIRDEIDVIDKEILSLYEKRMSLASDVAEYKISVGKQVYDAQREKEKLDKLSSMASDAFLKQGVRELFEQIMSTSRKKQYQILQKHGYEYDLEHSLVDELDLENKTVVFQGVEGAYSQQAMLQFFGDKIGHSFHVDTWRHAMEAIKAGQADYAVLPIENSSAGSIAENYDLLMEYDVNIIGEQIIKVDHALLGVKGASIDQIKTVFSHPQALLQCGDYLRDKHPNWDAKALRNTAVSAKKVLEDNDVSQAAIGSKLNASLYNLDILEECIQDNPENQTRFIIVSTNKIFTKSANKISICLENENEKGSLYHLLSHFIFNGLDLMMIESRPVLDKNWKYRFFIDFTGNLADSSVQNALRGVEAEGSTLKVLGNYVYEV